MVSNIRTQQNFQKRFGTWKDKQYTPSITWKILRTCGEFNRASMKCNLCHAEKLEIAMCANDNILNKRSELESKCRHVNKYKLFQKDSKDWSVTPLIIFDTIALYSTSRVLLSNWWLLKSIKLLVVEKNCFFF